MLNCYKKYYKTGLQSAVFHILLFLLILHLDILTSHCQTIKKDSLSFQSDTNLHFFNLLLPQCIEAKLPLLLFLDPSGKAERPLSIYSDLIEKRQVILASSWEIKNGPIDRNHENLTALLEHLSRHYPVDEKEIYLIGFSGGSRQAVYSALRLNAISGVIGCGSGLPPGKNNTGRHIKNYITIAGNRDMNLSEMCRDYLESKEKNTPHFLMITPEGHFWPDKKYMENALSFLNFYGSEGQQKALSQKITRIEEYYRQGLILEAFFSCNNLKYNYPDFQNLLPSFCNKDDIEETAIELLEDEYKDIYLFKNAMDRISAQAKGYLVEKRDHAWWRFQIDRIRRGMNNSSSKHDSLKNRRLMNFIQANLYEYAKLWVNFEHDYATGIEFLKIWALADSRNPFPDYYLARIYYHSGKERKSDRYLKKARKKGIDKYIESAGDISITDDGLL